MNMVQKLHRKFILAATAAVVIIVTGALSLINGILYVKMQEEISSVLTFITENGGLVAQRHETPGDSWFGGESWTEDTPEFSYQTRYFSVRFAPDGAPRSVNINHIAAFTAEEAVEYAQAMLRSGHTEGDVKNNRTSYAYMITRTADGGALVVVLDCTRDQAVLKSFFRYSLMFGLFCILLYVLVVTVLSKKAIQPFVRNMENQKRFITNAGHELKTPIAIISANTEALELISGKNQWTGNILKQVKRLSDLINDLILLSRMGETSSAEIELTDVDMSECVNSAAESFLQMIQDQGQTFLSTIQPDVHVKADARILGELVNILMDNAGKYCDEGGTITVFLGKRKIGRGVIFAVSNHYKDGANEDYSRFFERFYRGDLSHNSGKAGYGIGLSMAREMAALMKGRIQASYNKGVITFQVTLP